MKKIILLVFPLVLFSIIAFAQNVGIGTTTPNPSSILEINASNKGLLIPRTSTTSRTSILNPAKGLMVYDTTTNSFWYHSGAAWVQIGAGGTGWSLTGNSGTSPATNFIGTTDVSPIKFRVNNIKAGYIDTSTYNTSIGFRTLDSITSGQFNTALGYKALISDSSGKENTATGSSALQYNTSGFDNTANGVSALYSNTTGLDNTAIGDFALYSNTTGSHNSANGLNALYFNTGGDFNEANGEQALYSNTTGYKNTANGEQALYFNTTGRFNTANGESALSGNTTGNNNTALGDGANVISGDLTNATAIGYTAIVGASNTIQLGNANVTSVSTNGVINADGYKCKPGTSGAFRGNTFNIDWTPGGAAQLWIDVTNLGTISLTSDRRLKEDIDAMKSDGIERTMQLKPAHFKYKKIDGTMFSGSSQQQEGFIADELQQVIPSAVNGAKDALTSKGTIQPQTINIVPVVAVLTKAVQEQQQIIEELKKQNNQQQQQINTLINQMQLINEKLK